ncbi:MAG: asparagine synthase-related protein, partial [bacterium]|nr:asparagine synthase-related protein [bacterium]
QKIREMNINHIFTGQGPDILLAGYHKYKSLMTSEINATIEQDMPLLDVDRKRDNSMAQNFNITLHNPYLEQLFIDVCKTIPAEFKLYKEGNILIEKYILRQLGKKLGLPQEIINRKKKAFQYSTGLQKLVKKIV